MHSNKRLVPLLSLAAALVFGWTAVSAARASDADPGWPVSDDDGQAEAYLGLKDAADVNGLSGIQAVDWTRIKTKLVDVSCVKCHKAGNDDDIDVFNSYEAVRAKAAAMDKRMARDIDDRGVMPPKASTVPRPSAALKAEFKEWIAAGFPQ